MRMLLALVQADEEDWVRPAVGDRGRQGDDAQPDRGLPHGPLAAPPPAAAPPQHTRRWHKPGNPSDSLAAVGEQMGTCLSYCEIPSLLTVETMQNCLV